VKLENPECQSLEQNLKYYSKERYLTLEQHLKLLIEMKIYDKKKKLLAEIIKFEQIRNDKNFYTNEDQEFQFASFNLIKGTSIDRHIHNEQERVIHSTSEVIVVLEGSIKVQIYDLDHNLEHECELSTGDSIALYSGGHGLQTTTDAKFIEVKQGPYDQVNDKRLF